MSCGRHSRASYDYSGPVASPDTEPGLRERLSKLAGIKLLRGTKLPAELERLAEAETSTGLGDAMVIGAGRIEGSACRLAVMDFAFMGGSMGSVVGEKLARACESATGAGVPLVSVAASGGAR